MFELPKQTFWLPKLMFWLPKHSRLLCSKSTLLFPKQAVTVGLWAGQLIPVLSGAEGLFSQTRRGVQSRHCFYIQQLIYIYKCLIPTIQSSCADHRERPRWFAHCLQSIMGSASTYCLHWFWQERTTAIAVNIARLAIELHVNVHL